MENTLSDACEEEDRIAVEEELITPHKRPEGKLLPDFAEDECRLVAASSDELEAWRKQLQQSCQIEWESPSESSANQEDENDMEECHIVSSMFSGPRANLVEAEEQVIIPLKKMKRNVEIRWPDEVPEEPLYNGNNVMGVAEEEVEVEVHQGRVFAEPSRNINASQSGEEVCEEPVEEEVVLPTKTAPRKLEVNLMQNELPTFICIPDDSGSREGSSEAQIKDFYNVNELSELGNVGVNIGPENTEVFNSVPTVSGTQKEYYDPEGNGPYKLHSDVMLALEHLSEGGPELSLENGFEDSELAAECSEVNQTLGEPIQSAEFYPSAPGDFKMAEVNEHVEIVNQEQRLMCEGTGTLPDVVISEVTSADESILKVPPGKGTEPPKIPENEKPPTGKPKSKGLFSFLKVKSSKKKKVPTATLR